MLNKTPTAAQTQVFRADTLAEALERVRTELGPDAVMLGTREVTRPRWQFWRRKCRWIEVTAALGVHAPARFLDPSGTSATRVPRPEAGPSIPATTPLSPTPGGQLPPADREGGEAAASPFGVSVRSPVALVSGRVTPDSRPTALEEFGTRRRGEPALAQTTAELAAGQAGLAQQLASIQQMVSRLARQSAARGDDVPRELFDVFTRLIDAEVDEELARELVRGLHDPATGGTFDTRRRELQTLLEELIQCAPPLMVTPGQRRVIALVGPTGVGKTTTIAKLAANLRLRDQVRVGLVTVDTYRVAAVEQLKTYAEIIDLPMKVASTSEEMQRALEELAGLDVILIDTAGRSPRDDLQIQELQHLLEGGQIDEVHLVLSLSASLKGLRASAGQFRQAGATHLILTKLDEAFGMGALASAARWIPLPISYLTAGQEVPDDIEPAAGRRIARLVLGDEHVNHASRAAA